MSAAKVAWSEVCPACKGAPGQGHRYDETCREEPPAASVPDYDLRPVQNEAGTWDALDAQGYGHVLEFPTAEWVETWIDGYNTGARENA